jgi:hypothetical protein
MGFAVNICIDIVLGTFLTMWLIQQRMYYPTYGFGGWIAEMMPGLNDLPAWTTMTVLSVVRKSAEEGKLKGTAAETAAKMLSAGTLAGASVSFITNMKQKNMETVRNAGAYTEKQRTEENEFQHARVSSELRNIDGIRSRTPQNSQQTTVPQEPLPSYGV